MMAVALITFISVILATETFRGDITEELASEPDTTASGAGQPT